MSDQPSLIESAPGETSELKYLQVSRGTALDDQDLLRMLR